MRKIGKDLSIREKLAKGQDSPLRTYIELTVGNICFLRFLLYEFLTSVLGPMPGGIGFFLRKKFFPLLFRKSGKGLIIGRNVVFRHPHTIVIGDNVTIDDNCLIDGHGAGENGIVLEDHVIINRNCMVQAKAGPIKLGRRTSIGSNSTIVSMRGIEFGEAVLVAGGCYFSAGYYNYDALDIPIMDQGLYSKGPICIGAKAWFGTGVIVLDGVQIGEGAVVGAGAVVVKNIEDYSVAAGIPAKLLRLRK